MCGITGILYKGTKRVELEQLKKMASVLEHRGPDDEGYYINKDNSFGLGFRRLSIIDLKTGHQPVCNEDKSIWVALNGEIYNFMELREGLQKKGHIFYTQSDTEVLVHLYEDKGLDSLSCLRGMFAFCIWDENKKRMFLARDRVGKKPLFYTTIGEDIIFGSEIKAILQCPQVTPCLDLRSMDHYLTYGYSPPERSMFKGINKLAPGHYLAYDKDGVRTARYWSLNYENKLALKKSDYRELVLSTLSEATKIRLISDVPLGVLLSGGIDSSCIVALMRRMSAGPIKTFSIGFDDQDYNELEYARLIAKAFDTQHHEFMVRPDLMGVLDKLIWYYNEPFADPSSIPTYFVSKIAREHVTVVLNGDGGDESFSGYERYIALRYAHFIKNIPNIALKGIYLALDSIRRWKGYKETAKFSKVCTYFSILTNYEKRYIYPRLISYFSPQDKDSLYSADFKRKNNFGYSFDFLADIIDGSNGANIVDRLMSADILSYLPEDLLVKMDRATMANSLEGRSPFLDHKVMELAARIPVGLKLKGATTKYILKESFAGILPDKILKRGKMGFGVPIGRWFRKDLADFIKDILLSEEFFKKGFFEKGFVKEMIEGHISGRQNNAFKIWNLLNFELWHRMFIDKTWKAPYTQLKTG